MIAASISSLQPPASSLQNSPQTLILDPIPLIDKHGSMVQKTAVVAKSAALARAGSGVRPLSANSCSSPQLSRGEAFRPHVRIGNPRPSRRPPVGRAARNSNRNTGRVEHDPTHCKQRTAAQSTRHFLRTVDSSHHRCVTLRPKDALRRRICYS